MRKYEYMLHLSTTTMAILKNSQPKHLIAFDAHNHIHLSLPEGIPSLSSQEVQIAIDCSTTHDTINDETTIIIKQKVDHNNANGDKYDNSVKSKNISSSELSNIDGVSEHAYNIMQSFDEKNMNNDSDSDDINTSIKLHLKGMALMSTQPRDFPIVEVLIQSLQMHDKNHNCNEGSNDHSVIQDANNDAISQTEEENEIDIIPCFGVHPWFLQQANDDFEQIIPKNYDSLIIESISSSAPTPSTSHSITKSEMSELSELLIYLKDDNNSAKESNQIEIMPPWLPYLHYKLKSNPKSHVGEIGLDGARYDPITKELVCAMENQIIAFETQLHLAAHLEKSVSIHAVRSWGPLMDTLRRVKAKRIKTKKDLKLNKISDDRKGGEGPRGEGRKVIKVLPPKIYMHAFGGKPSLVDQIDAICKDVSETYYGFAPVINFRAPKTGDVIRKIGIDRLVLESDLEDYNIVICDLKSNVRYIADALGMEFDEVLERTNENARKLYGLQKS
mmetsp:Transcript_22551/g.27656  ORF Transcript_22551/g.27656 Transcript_22551/m.27656 type:complete len:502 (-) Transcript_22551:183-1688(-)